ncbi:DUF3667 domain-containing protein [Flavobacterium sp.]|uniref:DUF3667 domain-containing protein n=1 Tax=Flavobacterium sp. TaxID=239 RepID=UPI00120817E0|nr:DUF3667 domain-containing protein [Flavobacterium sp.]RZJ72180.1 MAG: DUF3667 domain-containing protein [Flavobacterium sp.]
MKHSNCLNCEKPVENNFCSHCGQRTHTHRMTLKHFFLHDLVHGVWHLERGIVFTLLETLRRPGQAALEYLSGKRIRYYNVFYLILLVIAANAALIHFYDKFLPVDTEEIPPFAQFIQNNIKYILIGWVPFLAFNGYLIMDRMRLNMIEHFIVCGISLLGTLLFCIPWFFIDFLIDYGYDFRAMKLLQAAVALAVLFYPVWTYVNAAGKFYKWWEYLWRFMVFYTILFAEFIAFLLLVVLCSGGLSQLAQK